MIDLVFGIPTTDILKIKKYMDSFIIRDIDELLKCFDEEKIKQINRDKLIKERDRLNELIKIEE